MQNQLAVNQRNTTVSGGFSSINLLDNLQPRVSNPEHLRRIAIIDDEDFDQVLTLVRKEFTKEGRAVSDEYLARGIYALKQYYAIAMLDPANAHAVSVPVDPFWHAHILHTERYEIFCNAVVGEYMHHRPLNHASKTQVAVVRNLYGYTLEVLPKLFTNVEAEFWPQAHSDSALICKHRGNQEIYGALQPIRLFEPNPQGTDFDDLDGPVTTH